MRGLIGRAGVLVVGVFASMLAVAAEPEAVPGEFIVKMRDGVSVQANQKAALSQELGAYVKSVLPDQNIVVVKRPVFEISTLAVKSMAQNPNVEIVEPNYIYRANRLPNDPSLGLLWGLRNIGQKDSSNQVGVAGVDIGAEQAWDIETGNPNTLIAVIDTGVDYNHPDLKANVWTNEAEANGKAGVDDDNNGFIDDIHGYDFANNDGDPMDDQGHGSHCSGTIAGKGDDGAGIVGVAWNAKIMGVKFLTAEGSGTLENALKSIDYATKMGAKIMSNSWGGGGASETLKAAIQRSHEAGALFVAAAGNSAMNNDSSPSYPASYNVPNVLSVAAIDNKGAIASFSNYGRNSVHVGAPGVNIYSSTGGAYDSWSGTSMACPHVSGIAALVVSHEPNLTNVEIKERIIATARPIAGLRGKVKSGGLANAYLALTNTVPQPDPNDPSRWAFQAVSISSEHNYKEKTNQTFEVKIAGAKEIALYFSKFETEAGYDFVKIYDANGKQVQSLSGNNSDSWSIAIAGDYARIVLTSDDSVNGYGFDITKVAYR